MKHSGTYKRTVSQRRKLQKQENIKIDYRIIEGSDHFFLNHLKPLGEHVEEYLDKMLKKEKAGAA